MEHPEKSIKHIEQKISNWTNEARKAAFEAGRILLNRESQNLSHSLKIHTEHSAAIKGSIDSRRERIEEIKRYRAELSRDQTKKKEIDDTIEKKEKHLLPWIEKTGKAVLRAAENGHLSAIPPDLEIDEILRHKKELNSLKADLDSIERKNSEGTFIKKTLNRGKQLIVQGNVKAKEVLYNRSLRNMGKRFLFENITEYTPEIQSVLEEIDPQRQELLKLKDTQQELAESIDHHLEQIDAGQTMEGTRHPEKKLEEEIENGEQELKAIYLKVGQEFISTEQTPDEELKPFFDQAEQAQNQISEANETIIKLQAALAIEELEKKETTLRTRLEGITEEINKRKEQKKALELDIKALETEIEQKIKIRGDLPLS